MNKGKIFKLINLLLALLFVSALFSPSTVPSINVGLRLQPILGEMASSHPAQTVRVIVQTVAGTANPEAQVAALGGEVTQDLGIINAFAAEITAGAAAQLAK